MTDDTRRLAGILSDDERQIVEGYLAGGRRALRARAKADLPTMANLLAAEVRRLRRLNDSFCERIAAQAELLARRAEK